MELCQPTDIIKYSIMSENWWLHLLEGAEYRQLPKCHQFLWISTPSRREQALKRCQSQTYNEWRRFALFAPSSGHKTSRDYSALKKILSLPVQPAPHTQQNQHSSTPPEKDRIWGGCIRGIYYCGARIPNPHCTLPCREIYGRGRTG